MLIHLDYDHTHNGTQYHVGDEIEVDDSSAEWLIENGRAHVATEQKKIKTGGKA
jgi:hypothetical protein